MSAAELLEAQMNSNLKQLNVLASGVTEATCDHKITPSAMTPKEVFLHLTECCIAVAEGAEGKEHAWGSYKPEPTPFDDIVVQFHVKRAEAIAKLDLENPEHQKIASSFLSLHESYHIGQLALVKMVSEPVWDPYSLYV